MQTDRVPTDRLALANSRTGRPATSYPRGCDRQAYDRRFADGQFDSNQTIPTGRVVWYAVRGGPLEFRSFGSLGPGVVSRPPWGRYPDPPGARPTAMPLRRSSSSNTFKLVRCNYGPP